MGYADNSKPFKLHTDACSLGLAGVLYQTSKDGLERVISYASRTLSKSERNYPAYKLELLPLKWALTGQFHEYLYGGNSDVYTDNDLLTYILTLAKLDAVGQYWVATLPNYSFQLHYVTGKSNVEADALSHIPWQQYGTGMPRFKLHDKVTITSCTAETFLFEAYSGKTVIPPQSESLFLGKLQVDLNPSITNQEWREQQRQDKTFAEI